MPKADAAAVEGSAVSEENSLKETHAQRVPESDVFSSPIAGPKYNKHEDPMAIDQSLRDQKNLLYQDKASKESGEKPAHIFPKDSHIIRGADFKKEPVIFKNDPLKKL